MAKPQPFPSITKTWHNTSYPAIDPKRPELSAQGKSVLITGGGTGIGAAVAYAFATAGVTELALTGRTQATLSATADSIKRDFPGVKVLTIITDVTSQASVNAAFDQFIKEFGRIDICISNAGYSAAPAPLTSADVNGWLKALDTNVKGSLFVVLSFLKHAKEGSYLLNTSTGVGHMPAVAGTSSYAASKMAAIRLFEYAAAENPGINVFNIQPGVVVSGVSRQGNGGAELDVDDVDLPGNFYVWLVSPEATFLRSKFVWANWDVEELKALKEKILNEGLIDIDIKGLDWTGWDVSRMVNAARNL